MIYPQNIESKIGFDKIRNIIKGLCMSSLGISFVEKIKLEIKAKKIKTKLTQVEEFRTILLMEESFPSNNFHDVRAVLLRLLTKGTTITVEELYHLLTSLQTILSIKNFFNEDRQLKYPTISSLLDFIYFPKEIIVEAQRIVDEKGRIKDAASENLLAIRRELRKLIGSGQNKVYSMLAEAKRKGWSREDAEVTLRNGRVVIPILANYKRSIKGFIHDESSTGQTSFIEPIELFETNNRIKELEFEEINEIQRILMAYSDFLRPEIEAMQSAYIFLGLIDFIRAKAKFALQEEASIPLLEEGQRVNWKSARHPLLVISHRQKSKAVIPNDITLDAEGRMLIVSGPNAGGKSVFLKTIALNQYMLQCGIPVQMRSISETGVFENIFIDIGDEQSIENDLSTYSSHLKNIKYFLDQANDKTLLLIDEFGTGTEPDLGGAIAAASLQELYHRGSYGVVTTHYAQLKVLADSFPAMVNGAMMFDTEKLTPLFKFKSGKPGSSFAFEIAKSIGLHKNVLDNAAGIIGHKKLNFDRQLQELENEKEEVERKLLEFESADQILADTIEKYNALYQDINRRKKQIIYDAQKQAKEIIGQSNKAIENAISEIRNADAEKKITKKVRQKIEQKKQEVAREIKAVEAEIEYDDQEFLKPEKEIGMQHLKGRAQEGDAVVIKGQSTPGIVESIKRNNAIVNFDSVKIVVKVDRLQRVKPAKQKKQKISQRHKGIMMNINQRASDFSTHLDIRGKRAEEALDIVKKWIDEAILTGNKNLEVLHGKGDGILRQILRDYLSGVEEVNKFKDASLDFGGSGKTIIELK